MHEPKPFLRLLLDQNIPQTVAGWLREELPGCTVQHVNELGFQGKTDNFLYIWAQKHHAIIVTYDEDFADSRFYPLGKHYGIVRLRVWPTTVENTKMAMKRLLTNLPMPKWQQCLIIIDNQKIRIRKLA